MMPRLLCIVAAAGLAGTAHADDAAVRATLQRSFPNSPIQSIAKTPVAGVLEAAVEGRVLYVTEDGRYILAGPLFDARTNRNLTDARLAQVNAIAFDKLNLERAIKIVKGTGARRIAIFEDPDCPYCKALEQTLQGIDNLTVYVFLFPIDQLHPDAAAKSKAVWCAPDRAKAWSDVMRTGVAPAGAADCDNPLRQIAEFAQQHRITGTPTMVLADGRRLVGAMPLVELEKELQRSQAQEGNNARR